MNHVYLECSDCRALLMDVLCTRPDEPEEWQLRCNCPFCGDESFPTDIQGGFAPVGYSTPKEDDPDDTIPSTIIDYPETTEDNNVYFYLKKATPNAKPVYHR